MRRLIAPLLAIALAVVLTSVADPAPASASSNLKYLMTMTLVNEASYNHGTEPQMCLGIPKSSNASGVGAIQWPCDGVSDQSWDVYEDLDLSQDPVTVLELRRTDTNPEIPMPALCLAVPNDTAHGGPQVVQKTCDNSSEQRWFRNLHQSDPTLIEFTNFVTGMNLAVSGGADEFKAGDPVIEWPRNVNVDQLWY